MPRPQNHSAAAQTPSGRRKIDPSKTHVDDLAAYLSTDIQGGLSPKEAEKRLLRRTAGTLFTVEKAKPSTYILPILKEPVMWLLLAVALVACVFSRGDVGIPVILLMLLHGGVCVLMNLSTKRLERQMQAYDVPLARVVRNHRVLRVPADMLVPGDVILLRRGDVVPADARLLSSSRLTVAEDTLDGDAARRETVYLDKSAGENPDAVSHRHSPVNMVYGGGLVVRGGGKALVTATGGRTHMGGLLGRIPSSHENTPPSALTKLKKRLSVANLAVAVVAIPLTAVGILTLGDRYDLLDLFATALALSVLTLTEHIFVFGNYLSTALRRTAANDPDPHLSCEIRSTKTLEDLRRMDHLVLMGTAALEDGEFIPESILTCGETFSCGQSAVSETAVWFAEKMFLYAEGMKSVDEQLFSAVSGLTAWAQLDVETLKLRLASLHARGDGVMVTLKQREPIELYLCPVSGGNADLGTPWVRCASQDREQALDNMDAEIQASWLEWVEAAEKQGKRVFALCSHAHGQACAEGLIAFEAQTCPKTKGVLSAFGAAGIDVTVFLSRYDAWDHTFLLRQIGLLQGRELPYVLTGEAPDEVFALAQSGVRVFAGCTPKDAVNYITMLQQKGRVVGACSVEAGDIDALAAADISITCTPAELKNAFLRQMPVAAAQATEADGAPESTVATDLCRYHADVVVRRCSPHGGGVCGIRRALLTAEQMQKSGVFTCRYIFLSQILRIFTVLLPLFMGLTVIPAALLLFSGFGMDLLAFYCCTRADVPPELTSRRMEKAYPKQEEKKPKVLQDIPVPMYAMIVVAAACVIPWTAALVAKLLNVSFGADLAYFGMLCLFGAQIALLITQKLPRRRRVGFFTTVSAVCIYVGGLSIALGAQLSVMWCLLIPLVQPLCIFVALKICEKIFSSR